ncbi:hypothetical protein V7147_06125 [Bacillus sp. JJ1521]|uniref:hypothetical protein n=1 Tax=Bacillus sp. JJ1521 TaxID=3122957 RepID=UPI003000028B
MGKFLYSTAPIENENETIYASEPVYFTVTVIAVNNSRKKKAKFSITLFQLNGEKTKFSRKTRELGPQESLSVDFNTTDLDRFIIEISGKQKEKSQVLFSATGKDEIGTVVDMLPVIILKNKD